MQRSAAPGLLAALGLALLLNGCASGPAKAPAGVSGRPAAVTATPPLDRDGPEARPPARLEQVPDAEPRAEVVKPGGANKPYQALGRGYVPLTGDPPFIERGLASWYGRKFHGRRTASGEVYDMYAMTAAHPTLPIPSYARIRNPANGREVVVRINDRGPFHSGRIVDLSYTAALKLGVLRGVAPVELERITYEQVRSGAWKRGGPDDAFPATAKEGPMSAGAFTGAVEVASAAGAETGTGTAPPLSTLPAPAPAPAPASASASASARALPAAAAAPASAPQPVDAIDGPSGAMRDPPDARGIAPLPVPAAGIYVQLGAFREREGAEAFQRRVLADADWLTPMLAVFGDRTVYRLQAGPYANRSEAVRASDRMQAALQLVPVIVERR